MTDRRYSENEISAIFEDAALAQEKSRQSFSSREGLTLAELIEAGEKAGISAEFVVQASHAVQQNTTTLRPKKFFGSTISVHHTINLDSTFSDEDWERLVVELRDTFQAWGKTQKDGSSREWRNGNLRVIVEPSSNGYRLRLQSLKGSAREALYGYSSISLRGWLQERSDQMKSIADRATAALTTGMLAESTSESSLQVDLDQFRPRSIRKPPIS